GVSLLQRALSGGLDGDAAGDRLASRAALEHALLLGPVSPSTCVRLGKALGALQAFSSAMRAIQRALEVAPRNLEAHWAHADLLVLQEQHEAAAQVIEDVVALDPDASETHRRAAEINARLGRHSEALKFIDIA